ncbi:hypothetical protein BDV19DRAFT_25360 [Aspergillus venezuelensis]
MLRNSVAIYSECAAMHDQTRTGIQAKHPSIQRGRNLRHFRLANLTFEYIQTSDNNLGICQIINLVRGNVPDLAQCNGLTAYLERKMAEAFKQNPDVFSNPDFVKSFGKDANLDPFLWEAMVATFKDKINELRTCNLLKDKILKSNPPIPAAVTTKETEDNLFLDDEALDKGIDKGEDIYFTTSDPSKNRDTFCENGGTELFQFKQERYERLHAQTQNLQIVASIPVETPNSSQNDGANELESGVPYNAFYPPIFFSRPAGSAVLLRRN